jgi:glycogen operon protein
MRMIEVLPGAAAPIGATLSAQGVNFSVYSRTATAIELLLFDHADDPAPTHVIQLEGDDHRTYHYWHALLKGVAAGQLYGYRAYGPNQPDQGLRFDSQKILVDPYAVCVTGGQTLEARQAASRPGDNCALAMKCVVVDLDAYDWEGDTPMQRPFMDAAIYEAHVRGFTRHPNSGVAPILRGTYAGLVEKIPYLQELGVQTIELMPIQQFDPYAAPAGHINYWGYQPVAFFAPHAGYSSRADALGPMDEFRDMVKALHRAGIEVILDVVFNHTAEVEATGPTLSLRGLDNPTYYLLDPDNLAEYINDTGTGNTINANETIVRRMILDCLRHWVQCMHVDGFRFDLASVLARDEQGEPLLDPPILWDIETDPALASAKIIAEPWDAAGLYQVATFVGDRWAVWNGQYRDTVRQYVKSDPGLVIKLADVVMGSASLYHQPGRDPSRSVNFITAHDGFTVNDLVSYNSKHNEENGENNTDGSDQNESWNCGAEGPTEDADVETLRERQIRNFLTILFLSQGRPMLLMGDEARRTQRGNNNAYVQDNEISWFDWDLVTRNAGLLRFTRGLLRTHQNMRIFMDHTFWNLPGGADIVYHGVRLYEPDWGDGSHSLAYELSHMEYGERLHIALNAYWEPLDFELPPAGRGYEWRRLIDTALLSPDDFCDPPAPLATGQESYRAQARSSVVFIACRAEANAG